MVRTAAENEVVAVVRSGYGRGIRLPIDPRQEKYYWAGQHDVPVQEALVRVLEPTMTFWDIGAHIGFFTILAARAVGPDGEVHAFEPMPHNKRRLERTIQLNGLPNVAVHGVAISGMDGSSVLYGHEATAMWTLMAERGDPSGVTVACRTIDSLASEIGDPAVLKIDVEGAELDALRGGLATIRRSNPTMVVEFAVPESVGAARALLPSYTFEQLSDLDWLLLPSRGTGA